jgi:hypothetical protein
MAPWRTLNLIHRMIGRFYQWKSKQNVTQVTRIHKNLPHPALNPVVEEWYEG